MRILLAVLVLLIAAGCNPPDSTDQIPVSEHYAETPDGVTLYYRVAGSGSETVIAPFALFHESAFDRLAKGRRIVTYDPRGRGRSDAVPLDRVSLDYLLSDLDTVRRAVGADKVALIGWSGGGMETFVYALRNPGRVTRLVQLAPVAARFEPYGIEMMEDRMRRTDAQAQAAFEARVAAGAFDDDPEAYCRAEKAVTGPPLFADPANPPQTPDICVYPNEDPHVLQEYFSAMFQSLIGYDWRDSLSDVDIPRLVIHGAKDNTPLEGNREWAAGQANARLLVIAGAGHWPHYEQPDETLTAIETFLGGDWPEKAVVVAAPPAPAGEG